MTERRNIGRRLENWGAWCTSKCSRGPDSMTGAICESMRRSALGDVWSGHQVRDRIDTEDAERIQPAIPKISQDDRWILNWCYVKQVDDWVVAKACGFPKNEFSRRLAKAQHEIELAITHHGKQNGKFVAE